MIAPRRSVHVGAWALTVLVVAAAAALAAFTAAETVTDGPSGTVTATATRPVTDERPLKVAVIEVAVIDNSAMGNSDSLRNWMVEAGLEPTRLLADAVARPESYAALSPRPSFAIVEASRVQSALDAAGQRPIQCRTQECVVKVGQAVGADRVITGEVTKLSVLIWFVTGRVTDVRTGKTLRQEELEVKGVISDLLPKVMVILARRFGQTEARAKT